MHLFLKSALLSSAFLVGAAAGIDLTPKVASASSPVVLSGKATPERTLNLRFESVRGVRNFTARLAPNRCAQFEQKSARAELNLEVCQDDGQTLKVNVFEWASSKVDTNKRRLSFSFNIDSKTLVTVASWDAAEGESVTVSASVQ